jgi:hypothetical protein
VLGVRRSVGGSSDDRAFKASSGELESDGWRDIEGDNPTDNRECGSAGGETSFPRPGGGYGRWRHGPFEYADYFMEPACPEHGSGALLREAVASLRLELSDFRDCGTDHGKTGSRERGVESVGAGIRGARGEIALIVRIGGDRSGSLPQRWRGLRVVVERSRAGREAGILRTLTDVICGPIARIGMPIRPRGRGATGTLGCFARRNGQRFALTCEHVLGMEQGRETVEAIANGKDLRLGVVAERGGLHNGAGTGIDAALIEIDERVRCRGQRPEMGVLVPSVIDPYEALARRTHVQKFGARTQLTYGRFITILDRIVVRDGSSREPRFSVEFSDAIEIAPDHGDSGAVVWTAGDPKHETEPDHYANNQAVGRYQALGLLVSTARFRRGYALPLGPILEQFGIDLLVE